MVHIGLEYSRQEDLKSKTMMDKEICGQLINGMTEVQDSVHTLCMTEVGITAFKGARQKCKT